MEEQILMFSENDEYEMGITEKEIEEGDDVLTAMVDITYE